MNLYSNDVGAAFVDIKGFAAYVGGSPTNMSVGSSPLGLKVGLLTAFGEDPVGDFISHFLTEEGVDVRFSPRKPGHKTAAVVLGIEPPDKFPLVFYRDNCADITLSIDDVLAAPISRSRVGLLERGPWLVIEKRVKAGCRIHERGKKALDVPGFAVKVQNILGAGDAFGSGFLFGYVKGWDLRKACRLGNACGAMVVTRHGCSVSMPFFDEVMAFANERGGL